MKKTYVKVRNFDGEFYPHVETLDGTPVQINPLLGYELLGTDVNTGKIVISLDSGHDRLVVSHSIDFDFYMEDGE